MFSDRLFPLLICLLTSELNRVENAPNPTDNIYGKLCHDGSESRRRLTMPEVQAALRMKPHDIKTRICLSLALYASENFTWARLEMISLPAFNVTTRGDKSHVEGRFDRAFRRYMQPILKADVSASSSQEAENNDAELMMTIVLLDSKTMTSHDRFQCLWTYLVDALLMTGFEKEAEEEMQHLDHIQLAALASRFFEKQKCLYAASLYAKAIEKHPSDPSYRTLREHCLQCLRTADTAKEDSPKASSVVSELKNNRTT